MPYTVADRVCETTTTTGTGTLTLAGALTGYRTWNAAIGTAATGYYLIEAVDGSGVATGDWEVGIGLLATTTTLQRLAVIASSNAGAAVTLAAGTKRVHLTAPARQLGFCGGLWDRSADLTAQDLTAAGGVAIAFPHEAWTTEFTTPFHDIATNNTRITLDGTRYRDATYRISAQVSLANVTSGVLLDLRLKDDLGVVIGRSTMSPASTNPFIQVTSYLNQISGTTRYVELWLQVTSDTSVDIKGSGQTWIALEVLQ